MVRLELRHRVFGAQGTKMPRSLSNRHNPSLDNPLLYEVLLTAIEAGCFSVSGGLKS